MRVSERESVDVAEEPRVKVELSSQHFQSRFTPAVVPRLVRTRPVAATKETFSCALESRARRPPIPYDAEYCRLDPWGHKVPKEAQPSLTLCGLPVRGLLPHRTGDLKEVLRVAEVPNGQLVPEASLRMLGCLGRLHCVYGLLALFPPSFVLRSRCGFGESGFSDALRPPPHSGDLIHGLQKFAAERSSEPVVERNGQVRVGRVVDVRLDGVPLPLKVLLRFAGIVEQEDPREFV